MARDFSYTEEIKIAADVRKFVPRQRAILFHGTTHPCSILNSNRLIYPQNHSEEGVSFTRQLHVAIYWALLGRMGGDEKQGAVFVFDRDKLAHNFSLTPFCWRKGGVDKSRGDFEAEEKIFRRDIPHLHKYILEVIWLPEALYRPYIHRDIPLEKWLKILNFAGVKDVYTSMRHKPEDVVRKLRHVEIKVSQGEQLACAIHEIGVSEMTYHRWQKDYGRLMIKPLQNKKAAA